MNKRKILMLLSVLVITILTVSGFYLLTGEVGIDSFINVNATKSGDWEKVYGEGPYTETGKKNNGQKYYIRYTGAATGRTTVDIKDETVEIDGKKVNTGVKKGEDDYLYIFGQKIETTYKMFSKNGSNTDPKKDITRVFVPASIAIDADKETGVLQDDGTYKYADDKGIVSNTFEGCTQDIDCIYHTGNIKRKGCQINERGSGLSLESNLVAQYNPNQFDFDRTDKIKNQSNVITYVYLGKDNIERNGMFSAKEGYNGGIKNCYVSSEIGDINYLFYKYDDGTGYYSDGTETSLNYALIDENGSWQGANEMFNSQESFQFSMHFTLPNSMKVIPGFFSHCSNIMFDKQKQYEFKLPDNVENINLLFYDCEKFNGTIKIPNTVKYMNDCFYGAGTSVQQADYASTEHNTPIVMNYSDKCIPALAYTSNVKGLDTSENVYKKLYDWELVYSSDIDAPYEYRVDNQLISRYYIHYRGNGNGDNKITLDLDKDKLSTRENKDGKLKYINDELYILFGNETISGISDTGIKLTSTYKMFEKTNYDSNDKLYRVFIPSCIAIDSDLTKDSNKGIASNTFDKTTQDIDCIYHTGDIKRKGCQINERGSGLSLESNLVAQYNPNQFDFDRTDKIKNQSNVITYVYLGTENIERNGMFSAKEGYNGGIKNCYVSSENGDINYLFYKYGDGDGYYSDGTETSLKYALIDENGSWQSANEMFASQESFQFSTHFTLPNSMKGIPGFFAHCSNIMFDKQKQYEFKLPDNVENINNLFYNCKKLNGTIEIPNTVKYMNDCFTGAGTSVQQADYASTEHNKPIVMNYYESCSGAINYINANPNPGCVYYNSLGNYTATQSLSESYESVSTVNSVEDDLNDTQNSVVEDETEWVTIIVNKKSVEEVADETQQSSQSVENVDETKSEEDEVQE